MMPRDKFTVRLTIDYLYCRNFDSSNPLSKQLKLVDMKLYLLQAKARASRLFDFDLILYVPSTIFQLYGDVSSRVEPILS